MFQGGVPFRDPVGSGPDDGRGGAGRGQVAFGVVGGFVIEAFGPFVAISFGEADQGFGVQAGAVAESGQGIGAGQFQIFIGLAAEAARGRFRRASLSCYLPMMASVV